MSSVIAIPSKAVSHNDEMISCSASSSSSSLYVPLHKRSHSEEHESHNTSSYTRDFLLSLARSPLARLAPEKKAHIRTVFPEIAMNRKMRKSIEYHAAQHEKAMKLTSAVSAPPVAERLHVPHPHPHPQSQRSPSPHHRSPSPTHNHSPSPTHHHQQQHHVELENPATYNHYAPLAHLPQSPRPQTQNPRPNLRRSRSGARAPERRRAFAFGLKMHHADLDSAATWRAKGARIPMSQPAVTAIAV